MPPAILHPRPPARLIIALAAIAGVCGELLAAVSMTRIAGPVLVEAGQTVGRLGFPYGLRWTLFAVISVAGWVGALLWTSSDAADRKVGPWLNLPAATGAGLVVGLDHSVHAAPGPWTVVAFVLGPAITLTSSALLHVIARQVARRADLREPAPPHVQTTVQQHVQAQARTVTREPDEPDEPDTATADAPTPPSGVPSVPDRNAAIERQVEWIVGHGDGEPTADVIAERYGIARRTAFRRLDEARKRRGVA
jgi:hypothetical protein